MLEDLDNSVLNFNQDSLLLLNITLAIIMFGVALELKVADFKYIFKEPKAFWLGIVAQFIVLPF